MTEADAFRSSMAPGPALGIGSSAGRGRDDFYDHLLRVCVLLLTQERASPVAEIRDRLRPLGFEQPTAAVEGVFEELRRAGLVEPAGGQADGDAPPVHVATAQGATWLRAATSELRRTEAVLGGFLARCGERLLSLT